ncbi:LuxR C-terminal-related transcriptional regulator [Kitasatospora sp. NPDC059571]|uniref:LuxR C-terminal-related transcriptional regulator n=1 Tax=Kitasatospora sp. NPDC059571 TaxID=3346871 RepID=UPI003682F9F9
MLEVLTDRQLELLRMIASGMTQARVAEEVGRSETTVNQMMHVIRQRLGAASTAEAVAAAGIVQVPVVRRQRGKRTPPPDDDPRFAIRGMRQVRDRHGIIRWEKA